VQIFFLSHLAQFYDVQIRKNKWSAEIFSVGACKMKPENVFDIRDFIVLDYSENKGFRTPPGQVQDLVS
jgi:hypothetical protein